MQYNRIWPLLLGMSSMALLLSACNSASQNSTPTNSLQNSAKLVANTNHNNDLNSKDDNSPQLASSTLYMYTINNMDNSLSLYSITPKSIIPALSNSPTIKTGSAPAEMAIFQNYNNIYAYVVNMMDGTIVHYKTASGGGSLIMVDQVVTDPQSMPTDIKFFPSNNPTGGEPYAYILNSGSNTISAYSVENNGSMTGFPSAGSSDIQTGTNPVFMTIAESFIYVVNRQNSSSLSTFKIGANGILTSLNSTPIPIGPSDFFAAKIGTDLSGNYLYVIGQSASQTTGLIYIYKINSDGTLGAPSTTSTGDTPSDIVFNGSYAYIANKNDGSIEVYNYNATDGSLTSNTTTPICSNGCTPSDLLIEGGHLYSLNIGSNTISAFSLNATSGGITYLGDTESFSQDLGAMEMIPAPAQRITSYRSITVDQNNNFIIMGDNGASFKVSADLKTYQYFSTIGPDESGNIPVINNVAYSNAQNKLYAVGNREILVGYESDGNLIWQELNKPNAKLVSVNVNGPLGQVITVGYPYDIQGNPQPNLPYTMINSPESLNSFVELNNVDNYFTTNNAGLTHVQFCNDGGFYISNNQLPYVSRFDSNGTWLSNYPLDTKYGNQIAVNSFYVNSACDYTQALTVGSIMETTGYKRGVIWSQIGATYEQTVTTENTAFTDVAVANSTPSGNLAIAIGLKDQNNNSPIMYSIASASGQYTNWVSSNIGALPFAGSLSLNGVAIQQSGNYYACAVGAFNVICSTDQGKTWQLLNATSVTN